MSSVKRAGPVRLIVTLGVAGLVSGLILVTAYLATQPIILRNQAKALEAAIYRVVPGSTTRKEFIVRDGKLVPGSNNPAGGQSENVVYGAYDSSGKLLGYAIPGEGPGFQDTISLIYGYDPHDQKIIGLEILESRETPGLGDKITKDPKFHENFDSLSVEPKVVAVKHGTKTAPNEVDSISGATISSKAVVSIIQKENARFLSVLNSAQGSEGTPQ